MRSRIVNTAIVRDEWFLSLPLEEQRFFLQMLITDRAEMSGVFEYPDRDLLHDMPFLSPQRLQLLKKRFEADEKMFFTDSWVWIANFQRHNYFTSPQQQFAVTKQLVDLQRRKPAIIKHFEQKGFIMPDEQEYLEKRRRNQTKKMVRRQKPYLMGAQLEEEVDRVLGIADSGVMDWATVVESGRPASQYQTPESVYPHIDRIAKQFGIKQSELYYHYKRKVLKYQGSGRTKNDYLAVLEECATKMKPLKRQERIQAVVYYSTDVIQKPMTAEQADVFLMSKGDVQ